MLAGDADAVVYAAGSQPASVGGRRGHGVDPAGRQERGVVFGGAAGLPDAVDAAFTDPLRQAALAGGVSFFTTGIDSGFANDVLPLVLSGVSRVIESMRVTEMFNYATYPDEAAVYEILGFGKPPEFTRVRGHTRRVHVRLGVRCCTSLPPGWASRSTTSRRATNASRPGVVRHPHRSYRGRDHRGDALHPDRIRRREGDFRRRPRDAHARRHRARTGRSPHISIPPKDLGYGSASGRGAYRVEIEGSPSMRCEFEMAEDHDHDLGARMAGSSRMVNAIPAVCAAPPGLLSALDLPLITGAGLVRPVAGPSPDSRLF